MVGLVTAAKELRKKDVRLPKSFITANLPKKLRRRGYPSCWYGLGCYAGDGGGWDATQAMGDGTQAYGTLAQGNSSYELTQLMGGDAYNYTQSVFDGQVLDSSDFFAVFGSQEEIGFACL
jgi:hypothetical protein